MKTPKRYIKATQGLRTVVYSYIAPLCTGTPYTAANKVMHHERRPALFAKGRRLV